MDNEMPAVGVSPVWLLVLLDFVLGPLSMHIIAFACYYLHTLIRGTYNR